MTNSENGHLRRNSIGTAHIVFFVVAAAAPLTAVLGVAPAAIAFGNGPGVPAVYMMVGALYLVFSIGFTAMSPYIRGASGFYAYVVAGLGDAAGGAIAAIAVASYQAIAVGAYGLLGYFAHQAVAAVGVDMPWWLATLPVLALVQFCGSRSVTFSGNLLAGCMIGEIAILLALVIAIFATRTTPLAGSLPMAAIAGPGLGVAIVFVVASFIGFEATVIFGEEARTPEKTIPRATVIAVILIAVFYGLCTWSASIFYGPGEVAQAAARDPGGLYLQPIRRLLGAGAAVLTQALLMTSLFACILSFHATISRYLSAMAQVGLAPVFMGRIDPVHGSPTIAGRAQSLVTVTMIGLAAVARVDPFAGLFAWAGSFASLGVLLVQLATSLAVLRFFRRARSSASAMVRIIAPVLSAAGLALCLALATINLPLIAGSESKLVYILPMLLLLCSVAGWMAGRGHPGGNPVVFG